MNKLESNGSSLTTMSTDKQATTFIPLRFFKRSGRFKIVKPNGPLQPAEPDIHIPDTTLLRGLARAFYWQRLIDRGIAKSGTEIAKKEGLDLATVNEHLRLTLLAPQIIRDMLNGVQPEGLTLNWLTKNPIPWDWQEQRRIFAVISSPEELPLGFHRS